MGNLTQIWQITTCCQFVSRACLDIFLFYLINNDTANTTISYWSVPIQRIQINLVHREDPSKDQLNIVSCLLPVCAVIDQDFCTVKHCISKLVQKTDIKTISPFCLSAQWYMCIYDKFPKNIKARWNIAAK